ncbi:hypothetical protein AC249_AIPGENE19031 [Exaiptasia diaphana]|nr:hypothetical protein AC249_AIPGENE19031 [Exaiptasia diaphana]
MPSRTDVMSPRSRDVSFQQTNQNAVSVSSHFGDCSLGQQGSSSTACHIKTLYSKSAKGLWSPEQSDAKVLPKTQQQQQGNKKQKLEQQNKLRQRTIFNINYERTEQRPMSYSKNSDEPGLAVVTNFIMCGLRIIYNELNHDSYRTKAATKRLITKERVCLKVVQC